MTKRQQPNQAERERFKIIMEIGCICCLKEGIENEPCQAHHIVDRGRRIRSEGRREHEHVLGWCPWHHEGQKKPGYTEAVMKAVAGPSYKLHRSEFFERYGDQWQQLEYQNQLIEQRKRETK